MKETEKGMGPWETYQTESQSLLFCGFCVQISPQQTFAPMRVTHTCMNMWSLWKTGDGEGIWQLSVPTDPKWKQSAGVCQQSAQPLPLTSDHVHLGPSLANHNQLMPFRAADEQTAWRSRNWQVSLLFSSEEGKGTMQDIISHLSHCSWNDDIVCL